MYGRNRHIVPLGTGPPPSPFLPLSTLAVSRNRTSPFFAPLTAKRGAVAADVSSPAATAPAKTKKLSFKEQRELDGLPDQIAALEAEQKEITEALADGSLYSIDNVRAMKLATRNAEIDDELMGALERWELLGNTAKA